MWSFQAIEIKELERVLALTFIVLLAVGSAGAVIYVGFKRKLKAQQKDDRGLAIDMESEVSRRVGVFKNAAEGHESMARQLDMKIRHLESELVRGIDELSKTRDFLNETNSQLRDASRLNLKLQGEVDTLQDRVAHLEQKRAN